MESSSIAKCVNCGSDFEAKLRGYKRTPLLSERRTEDVVKEVFGVPDLTPKQKKKDVRFLCDTCEKLLKSAASGHQAKQELFTKTTDDSYMGTKRKHVESLHSTPLKVRRTSTPIRKTTSTPTSTPIRKTAFTPTSTPIRKTASTPRDRIKITPKKRELRMSSGARYLAAYKYKPGFKYYVSKSGSAFKALRDVLCKRNLKDMKTLLRSSNLPNMRKTSLRNFEKMDMEEMVHKVKTSVPLLHDALVSSMKANKRSEDRNVNAVLGMIIGMVTSQARPRQASLLQEMNSVQMWRAGCKRSLFHIFNRMGICTSETAMLHTLDKLKTSFDQELLLWKSELEKFVFPDVQSPVLHPEVVEGPDTSTMTSEPSTDSPAISIDSEDVSSISTTSPTVPSSPVGSPATLTSSENEEEGDDWVDLSDNEEDGADATIQYDAPVPKGYTLCWDNVGKQVKARRQTRNHGNKYKNWALAFAIKNRVCTTTYKDAHTVAACDIPTDCFFISAKDKEDVRERLINVVQRIMVKYMKVYEAVAHLPSEYMPHLYDKESCQKSEMFNIGIIDENPSSTAGVINIIERLHSYVPTDADDTLFPLVIWGDGLSCERHVDAQNARANADTPKTKLRGLEPAAQEFHKRMLLLQDVMDKLFSGKSAMDKGTLFHLKNLFNQRSVTSNVSESFNYVSDFVKFVTEGYVLLFAMDILQLKHLEDKCDVDDLEISLNSVSEEIVDRVWIEYEMTDTSEQKPCFCKEDSEEDEPMIECDNDECDEGAWFHLLCVGLDEDKLPEEWFCSDKCRQYVLKFCKCKQHLKGEPMVECCNLKCKSGQWFHAKCVGLRKGRLPKKDEKWYCSNQCKKVDQNRAGGDADHVFEYTKMITWAGLNDMIRREAVRNNDGLLMVKFWKMDMPLFFSRNHTKYSILGHRLLTAINGFLPERLRQDLIWNRTVNIRGGRGRNDEIDLVNEFLNREFKESIRSLGAQTTHQSLERHGKLAGGLGKVLDETYVKMVEGIPDKPVTYQDVNRKQDMNLLVETLLGCELTREIEGRAHKAFPKINSSIAINRESFLKRIKKSSKKMDKAKRVANN